LHGKASWVKGGNARRFPGETPANFSKKAAGNFILHIKVVSQGRVQGGKASSQFLLRDFISFCDERL